MSVLSHRTQWKIGPSRWNRAKRPVSLAFILFRQHHHATVMAQNPGKPNPEISKIIGHMWKTSGDAVKAQWQAHADVRRISPQRNVSNSHSLIGRETATFATISAVSVSATPKQQKDNRSSSQRQRGDLGLGDSYVQHLWGADWSSPSSHYCPRASAVPKIIRWLQFSS